MVVLGHHGHLFGGGIGLFKESVSLRLVVYEKMSLVVVELMCSRGGLLECY